MQKSISIKDNTRLSSTNDSMNKRKASLGAAGCALLLLIGFFFAGHQHFSSMDYGIRNSRLRKQIDDLRAEKQRLLYTREVSLSPNEIKKAAKKVGFFKKDEAPQAAVAELASFRRNKDLKNNSEAAAKPAVIKTSSVEPTAPKIVKTVQLVSRNEKTDKRTAK